MGRHRSPTWGPKSEVPLLLGNRGGDLSFQLHKLAPNVPSFCCASVLTRAYSAAFVIHGESIPEIGSVVESSAVDIEAGEGKSVCMASCFSEGQHMYSTGFWSKKARMCKSVGH